MLQVARQVKETLDEVDPAESLSELFCEVLNWGQSDRLPQEIQVGQPVDDTFTVHPVAELGGVPVFRLHWPEKQLPLVTEKRAVYRQLQKTAREHLICYVTEAEDKIAFVWAREQEEKSRAEMRTLPFEQDSGARTTVEQLAELKFSIEELGLMGDPGVSAVIDRLDKAFDVERVTDEFFETYEEIFTTAEEAITGIEGDEKRLFTQKIFNRLLFIRFLEKKGWLRFDGRDDYLQALWDDYQSRESQDNFYNERLRPLFFEALNNEKGENRTLLNGEPSGSRAKLRDRVGLVPFLNGGLFEKSTGDEKDSVTVPDEALRPVFEHLFYHFNFTVTESTPLDIEVAVDPEMLGRIFEELVTGRHETGSYYTPKQVVSFMCKEALKNYLTERVSNAKEEAVERFVYEHQAGGLHNPEAVLTALRTVTVCDPACGSGAYLLGMLRELLDLRNALFQAKELDNYTTYQRKQEIIQQNLYGVDIDDFAVNIARLRLWLSLVVDDQRNPLADPDAEVALPNLDYKIEVGDALTAPDPQSTAELQDQVVRRFQKKKAAYMKAHDRNEKEQIQRETSKLREQIATWAQDSGKEDSFNWAVEFAEIFADGSNPVATWTGELPLTEGGKQALLHEERVPGGFDIVLANPPYLRQEVVKRQFGDKYKDLLKRLYPETYVKTADAYVPFYQRANQLLRPGGVGSYIASNSWLRAGYGEDLRQYLLDGKATHLLVDFGEQPVFDAAIDPAIVCWQRWPRNDYSTIWAKVKDLSQCYEVGIKNYVRQKAKELPADHFTAEDPNRRARLIDPRIVVQIRAMEKNGQKLKRYVEEDMKYGVKTGLNEIWVDSKGNLYSRNESKPEDVSKEGVFVIGNERKKELISKNEQSREIIKPLIKGDDVRRYNITFRETYLIWTYVGVPIDKYTAIKDHIRKFESKLKERYDQGDKWWELRHCKYYDEFENNKIIYPDIGKKSRFVMDVHGYFSLNTTYFIPVEDWYLLGVLNSRPVFEYLKNKCLVMGDEDEGGRLRFFGEYMENLPIPEASSEDRTEVSQLAKRAQQLHMRRRECVEEYMNGIGFPPSESSSRNSLEEPWQLDIQTFKSRARNYGNNPDPQLFKAAKDITMELNTEIEEVEQEIDEKVAALYDLDLDDISG